VAWWEEMHEEGEEEEIVGRLAWRHERSKRLWPSYACLCGRKRWVKGTGRGVVSESVCSWLKRRFELLGEDAK
jgi:hypothetical protein